MMNLTDLCYVSLQLEVVAFQLINFPVAAECHVTFLPRVICRLFVNWMGYVVDDTLYTEMTKSLTIVLSNYAPLMVGK
jgi:hypothetical protein